MVNNAKPKYEAVNIYTKLTLRACRLVLSTDALSLTLGCSAIAYPQAIDTTGSGSLYSGRL